MTVPWEDPRVIEGTTRQLAERRRLLGAGAAHVGWKVGFGAPSALELMEISAPLVGFLTDRTVLDAGSHVLVGDWSRGIIEFEVAVYMAEGLAAGASDEQARAAVGSIGPAIELADIDLPLGPDEVGDILAGDIFHEAVIFGDRDPDRSGIDISGLTGRIVVDGEERAALTELEEITGAYPRIVSTVASTLASQGERLRAGDVIITGSIVPPIPVTEGTTFTFALDPFTPISAHLEHR